MKHEDALRRLKTVEGHLRGIQRMVEEEAYCMDIIQQIRAVQGALNKINNQVLEEHLHSCVITAIRGDDAGERERVLMEISGLFNAINKV